MPFDSVSIHPKSLCTEKEINDALSKLNMFNQGFLEILGLTNMNKTNQCTCDSVTKPKPKCVTNSKRMQGITLT